MAVGELIFLQRSAREIDNVNFYYSNIHALSGSTLSRLEHNGVRTFISPTNGVFVDVPQGDGYTLTFVENGVTIEHKLVIGVIVACLGQSNMRGWFANDPGVDATAINASTSLNDRVHDTYMRVTDLDDEEGAWVAVIGDGARTFAGALSEELGAPVALINAAVGNTALIREYTPLQNDTNYWANPNSDLYQDFLTQLEVIASDNDVQVRGPSSHTPIEIVTWIQGEADAVGAKADAPPGAPEESEAITALEARYETDLGALFTRIISSVGGQSNFPKISFMIGAIGDHFPSDNAYFAAVRKAQADFANASSADDYFITGVPATAIAELEQYDGLHFSRVSSAAQALWMALNLSRSAYDNPLSINDVKYDPGGTVHVLTNLGAGRDLVFGGADADSIRGGDHADVLRGEGGADTIFGENGSDALAGGSGNDRVDGGSGNDVVDGGSGNDTLTGGVGDDVLYEGDGTDTLAGGDGNDVVMMLNLEATQTPDQIRGDAGRDLLSYERFDDRGVTVMLGASDAAGTAQVMGFVTLDAIFAFEDIFGSAQNDILTGNAGANAIDGFGGDDTIIGGGGADTLRGDDGADRFTFLSLADSSLAQSDSLFGFAAEDRIDLSAIDANGAASGDAAFVLASTGAGRITLTAVSGAQWSVKAYVDADANVDMQLLVYMASGSSLGAAQFML